MIDEGTLTVEAIMEPRIHGPQFDVTYSYVLPSIVTYSYVTPKSN